MMASSIPAFHCIVCTLTKIPFATLGKDTQQKIVKSGRPTSQMPNLYAKCHHSINLTAHNWMTGCDKNQRLYCWPCLLFNTSEFDMWGKRGISDFHRLSEATLEHSKDVSHQAKSKTLNLWMETYSDGSDDSSEEELECIPELDFLNLDVPEEEEELDVKPNVEALNASSSSSSQHAVTAFLDLCDPAGVTEIEMPGSSPIVVRDNSPEPALATCTTTTTTATATAVNATTIAESQDYEKANIYRTFCTACNPAFLYIVSLTHDLLIILINAYSFYRRLRFSNCSIRCGKVSAQMAFASTESQLVDFLPL